MKKELAVRSLKDIKLIKSNGKTTPIYTLIFGLFVSLFGGVNLLSQILDQLEHGYYQLPYESDKSDDILPLTPLLGPIPDLTHTITPTLVTPGDKVEAVVAWRAGDLPLDNVVLTYTLPLTSVKYVSNSAKIEFSDRPPKVGQEAAPDLKDMVLVWQDDATLNPEVAITISFQIVISQNFAIFPPVTVINNEVSASGMLRGIEKSFYSPPRKQKLTILSKPSLTVVLKEVPLQNNEKSFDFTLTRLDQTEAFKLSASDSKTFSGLEPGVYTVTENIEQTNNKLTFVSDIGCSEAGDYTVNLKEASIYLRLNFGNTATCIFTNTIEEPTFEKLGNVEAISGDGHIIVQWSTVIDFDTIGFNVFRSTVSDGPFQKVNSELIEGNKNLDGGKDYIFLDAEVNKGVTYYYFLQEVSSAGDLNDYKDWMVWTTYNDPILDSMRYNVYLPSIVKN